MSQTTTIPFGADAGPARDDASIRPISTVNGAPYDFTFHLSDSGDEAVGHTLLYAPTGGGMTTLFSFLAMQASAARPNTGGPDTAGSATKS